MMLWRTRHADPDLTASLRTCVIVAAKLNDEKFSFSIQPPTCPTGPHALTDWVRRPFDWWNDKYLALSFAIARKNCYKLWAEGCGYYYCVIIKAFLMLNVKCRTDKQPQLSMQRLHRQKSGFGLGEWMVDMRIFGEHKIRSSGCQKKSRSGGIITKWACYGASIDSWLSARLSVCRPVYLSVCLSGWTGCRRLSCKSHLKSAPFTKM